MRKLSILLFFIVEFGLIQGQSYVSFPDSNAFWSGITIYQGTCDPPDYCKYTYFLQGDTTIDLLTYHKLYSNDSSSISYLGGLREDDKRIYFYDKNCTHNILLYDFNLTVGDSILLTTLLCYNQLPLYMKVSYIDSVLLEDMTYRKRINFSGYSDRSWIEGIGSKAGLLYPYFDGIPCMCWLKLICFKQNDITLFKDESLVPCFNYMVSNKEFKNNSNLSNVYPNPVNNKITIDLQDFNKLTDIEFSICNIQGQVLIRQSLLQNKSEIDISHLEKGVYLLKLKNKENIIVHKFVKE